MLTNDKDDLNKYIRVNSSDGLLVLFVPKCRTEWDTNGHIKGRDQNQPIKEGLEGSIVRQNENWLLR